MSLDDSTFESVYIRKVTSTETNSIQDTCDGACDQHDRQAALVPDFGRDGRARFFRECGHDDVGGRADDRAASAEACAERERPPQRRHVHARFAQAL